MNSGLGALKPPPALPAGAFSAPKGMASLRAAAFAEPVPSLRSGKAFDYPGLDALKTPAGFAGGGLQRTQRDSNP